MTEEEEDKIIQQYREIENRRIDERQKKEQDDRTAATTRMLSEAPPQPVSLPWVTCDNCKEPFRLTKYGPVETALLRYDYDHCCAATIRCPYCGTENEID